MGKTKIRENGQPCRNCGTPVIEEHHEAGWEPKAGQRYYFKRWFRCDTCLSMFMDGSTKVTITDSTHWVADTASLPIEEAHRVYKARRREKRIALVIAWVVYLAAIAIITLPLWWG